MTKKIAILAVLLYIAGTASGQEFTFQGLPWGTSKEQAIKTLGKPIIETEDRIVYSNVSIAGYRARLEIEFDHGMSNAGYTFNVPNPLKDYETIIMQLIGKYGDPYAMKQPIGGKNDFAFAVWNHSNFHIMIQIEENGRLGIVYCSDMAWLKFAGNIDLEPYKTKKFEL